jgi:hypothetical protein
VQHLLEYLRGASGSQILIKTIVVEGDAFLNVMQKPPTVSGLYPLADNDAAAILTILSNDRQGSVISRPTVMVANGVSAIVQIGQEIPSISGYTDTGTKKDGVEVFTPVVKPETLGLKIGMTAKWTDRENTSVNIKVAFGYTTLIEIATAPWPDAPAGRTDLLLHVPRINTRSFGGTSTTEPGKWMLMYLPLAGQQRPGMEPAAPATNPEQTRDGPIVMLLQTTLLEPNAEKRP